jgi:hypothetical protein
MVPQCCWSQELVLPQSRGRWEGSFQLWLSPGTEQ